MCVFLLLLLLLQMLPKLIRNRIDTVARVISNGAQMTDTFRNRKIDHGQRRDARALRYKNNKRHTHTPLHTHAHTPARARKHTHYAHTCSANENNNSIYRWLVCIYLARSSPEGPSGGDSGGLHASHCTAQPMVMLTWPLLCPAPRQDCCHKSCSLAADVDAQLSPHRSCDARALFKPPTGGGGGGGG